MVVQVVLLVVLVCLGGGGGGGYRPQPQLSMPTDGLKKPRFRYGYGSNDEVILGEQEMIIMHEEKLTSISALIDRIIEHPNLSAIQPVVGANNKLS